MSQIPYSPSLFAFGPESTMSLAQHPFSIGQPLVSIAQAVSNISTTANNLAASSSSTSAPNPNAFRAPAHKHAHHLHTIPPREKSTRTLIIDHMLWVHARTRFAQARAELGMTDRTGGPASPHYTHRQRPENYDEDDEEPSDGEHPARLRARAGGPGHPHDDDDDDRVRRQDLALARALRLRAEGLEKVVVSMLEQPPPLHPSHDDIILTPPSSPKMRPLRDPSHPHTLPNGVRLRLALGTVINDLFARQAPLPPYRHQHHASASNPTSSASTPTATAAFTLPSALACLSTISAEPSHGYLSLHSSRPKQSPSARTRELYTAGADPSTANAPPAFRCPRHLHTGCEICVAAKSSTRPGSGSSARGRAASISNADGRGDRTREGGGITGWQDGCGVGSGLARPGVEGSVLRRLPGGCAGGGGGEGEKQGTGAGNTKLSALVPRFMRLSALVAMELGREAKEGVWEGDTDAEERRNEGDTGAESVETSSSSPNGSSGRGSSPQSGVYVYTLRPSGEWYALLAGLLTRAVLEGYLTAGWLGLEAVECLMEVGLGIVPASSSSEINHEHDHKDEEFKEFDPDGLPSLVDAAKMLFPSLRDSAGAYMAKGIAEMEFEMDMNERLRRFYDIPASTPDLSTHMEDLAWQFPAEPVERAAVRFCEAIAKWRGKPELETYKKKPPPQNTQSVVDLTGTPGGSTMTMESLVHSSPTSPSIPHVGSANGTTFEGKRPSIERYFIQMSPGTVWDRNANGNKRMRSPSGGRTADFEKRLRV